MVAQCSYCRKYRGDIPIGGLIILPMILGGDIYQMHACKRALYFLVDHLSYLHLELLLSFLLTSQCLILYILEIFILLGRFLYHIYISSFEFYLIFISLFFCSLSIVTSSFSI
jgi:hypothetical protein